MFPVQFPQLQLLSDHFLHTKHSQAPITSWLPYTGQERSQVRVWANLLFLRIKISRFASWQRWWWNVVSFSAFLDRRHGKTVIWEIYTSHLAQSKAKLIGGTQVLVNNVVFSRTSSNNLQPDYHEAVMHFVHLIGRKKNFKGLSLDFGAVTHVT